ncbi:uncharacterized protein LOC110699393 [Chenopodium quinoa]|uniref:uncharacterized protein LOC110699393 n=1 Tax=Chenopodium quinoa TaxID=63459 RepID=UPI000B7709C4|nr:uncharacterized protein LOC110699393 [Chenopodium quinoa]
MWLDVHYKDQGFDVFIEDTDRTSLMDLYEYMFEDYVKQNVILPKYEGRETIEVFLEEKDSPSLVFKDAEASWQKRVKALAEKARLDQEKAQRMAEEEEAARELREQQHFTVVVEVPVGNSDDSNVEYFRVFDIEVADERSDESSSDSDSEDDDYILSGSEEDDDEADIADFIEDETKIDCLHDDIPDKQFEDYLDGSSTMDKTYKNGKIWSSQKFGSIRLEPWLIFGDRKSFLDVFKDYCVQEGFGVYVEKSDKTRLIARCAIKNCNWRIYASTMMDKVRWAIKSLTGEHKSCGRLERNPIVSSEWLCRHLQSNIEANPDIPVESLHRICMERFRLEVKKRLLYKVRAMSKEIIHGHFGEAYSLLPRGFLRGCRPFIGIDGAHLSGHFKGILLTAVGIDGNNAYRVVGSESVDSLGYFLRNLKILFEKEGCKRDDWTFISDRMKGVDTTIYEAFPRATRRVCCQHLYMNCKANGFSGSAFHKLFWIAADAYNEYVFNKAMQKIQEYNLKAVEYLESCTEIWSRHKFDPALCYDHNTTNFLESFNSCTKPYRDLPVVKILEGIRQWGMKRIASRFDKAASMGDMELTEYAAKILQTRSNESRLCYETPCGGDEFEFWLWEVATFWTPMQTCTKGYYQRLQPTKFLAPCFKGKAYKLTYFEHMHPMPDPSQWPLLKLPNILPPSVKIAAGRPKKQRRRGPNEARKGKRHSTVKCSLCKELGHNMLTCASRKKSDVTEESTSTTSSQAKKKRKRAA